MSLRLRFTTPTAPRARGFSFRGISLRTPMLRGLRATQAFWPY
jgi:hypothetical protein